MINKRKEAIKILNALLIEIDTIIDVNQGNNWKSKLKDTLNLYIGESSAISSRLDKLYFTRKETKVYTNAIGFYDVHIFDENKKEDFRNLINNAVNYVESNGVYKITNKNNFLSEFKNPEIIGGIFVTLGMIFGIGNYFGKLEKDREIIDVELKMKVIDSQNKNLKIENENLKENIINLKNKTNLIDKTSKIK
jgi:hypothetical protein